MINSFWGKFGQHENQSTTYIVNESEQFYDILINSLIYVNTVIPVNEDTLIINWEQRGILRFIYLKRYAGGVCNNNCKTKTI